MRRAAGDPEDVDGLQVIDVCRYGRLGVLRHLHLGGMAFKPRHTDQEIGVDSFALVTVSGAATFTGIPDGTYVDAVTGNARRVTDGTPSVAAPGKGNLRVHVLDLGGANAVPGQVGEAGPCLH